jgi:hypothetical protein
MSFGNGTGTMVSLKNVDTAQNDKINEILNEIFKNVVLAVPTKAEKI